MTAKETPTPHRCPFWVQYLLVSPLRKWLEPADKLLAPHVRRGMTVLEPGCGFGYFSLTLAKLVGTEGKVLCVDVEPRAVERLKRRALRVGLSEQIEASACGPRDLGLDAHAGQVDLVVMVHTLHELEDLPGFLAQVAELLSPQGRMLVVETTGHVKQERFDAMMTCCREAGFRELEAPRTGRKQLAALLTGPD